MSAFGGLILTRKGLALQAKAQLGATLNFSKMKVGDGDLGGSAIVDLTDLKHAVKTLSLNKFQAYAEGQATVGSELTNSGLLSGFYWKEVGLFAIDPQEGEILYCYGNQGANAEYIPADGGPDVVEKQVNLIAIFGSASSVSATINQSLVFVSQDDLDALAAVVATKETTVGAQSKADLAQQTAQLYARRRGKSYSGGAL